MSVTITGTSLCVCHHIYSMHNQDADCMLCRCSRFQLTSRKSSSHYQRGQTTSRRRLGRLAVGDRILVGFPGHDEYVYGRDKGLIWVQELGQVMSHPLTKRVEDDQLRPVDQKTGALVATVTEKVFVPAPGPAGMATWIIDTSLGKLSPLPSHQSVHVLLEAPPW